MAHYYAKTLRTDVVILQRERLKWLTSIVE